MSTGPDIKTRLKVIFRSSGHCMKCGDVGHQIHHRKPRGMGGTSDPAINDFANLVLLCEADHRWVERYRTAAYATGWLVHREAEPAGQHLVDDRGRVFQLTVDGGVVYPDPVPDLFLTGGVE